VKEDDAITMVCAVPPRGGRRDDPRNEVDLKQVVPAAAGIGARQSSMHRRRLWRCGQMGKKGYVSQQGL